MTEPKIWIRHMASATLGGAQVLDIVSQTDPARGDRQFIFFAKDSDIAEARMTMTAPVVAEAKIDGAPLLICSASETATDPAYDGSACEPDLLAGLNVAIATRNNEPAETIAEWLNYHHDRFDLGGAVIFERAKADEDPDVWDDVASLLEQAKKPLQVVVVFADSPLGALDMPAEAHPFCVAEAPGRDRMEVPAPDPWRAPLREMSIFEIARRRFLGRARAIANIDLHDLLYAPAGQPSPFDLAARSPGTVIELIGKHCYPWRVRKNRTPRYGDHSCVQFDQPKHRRRWCVCPADLPEDAFLRCQRVSNLAVSGQAEFFRFVAIRHPVTQSSLIVPKASLIEYDPLIALARDAFDFKPVRAPTVKIENSGSSDGARTAIVTTMKNEGPFILEWLAYHRAIGVRDFLVYTNDCSDGTDEMFDLLQAKGLVQHRDNPFRQMDLKPQHAALQMAESEKVIRKADWVICMDVDEFINIKVGDGLLTDLYAATDDANMISCTWRLFGNSDVAGFKDAPTIAMFDRCAKELSPKPHQAWGFKTLFRNIGIFKKLGVHRPKGLRPQIWDQIRWVNGSGKPLPKHEYRNAWRSNARTYGYDLVSLNHYAVRNAESFLVKRDRGRVNHVDRDQGLAYWFRMNNNTTTDRSIQRHIPKLERELRNLLADPEIAAQHDRCVQAHRTKIDQLKADPKQLAFFEELTSPRMKKLSRLHGIFGANVFLSGPQSVPNEVVWADHPEGFFFTIEAGETNH